MRLARVIAALSFLGLIVSVAMPVMTNGRASGAEALPFVVGFGSLLAIAGPPEPPAVEGEFRPAPPSLWASRRSGRASSRR